MKTPEEIKKGLECCSTGNYLSCRKCPYEQSGCGEEENLTDALAYIQQLETDNARLAERTAKLEARNDELELWCAKESTRKAESDLNYTRAINALVEQIPKWISVDERLPEDQRIVLVYDKLDSIGVCQYSSALHRFFGDAEETFLEVTHWMPLPELPKEDGHAQTD